MRPSFAYPKFTLVKSWRTSHSESENRSRTIKNPPQRKFSAPAADILRMRAALRVSMLKDHLRWYFIGVPAALFLCAGQDSFALDPSLSLSQYLVEDWQIQDGLPQTSAQAIARTPDGYLWIGTQEGLARFDGVRFTVFVGGKNQDIPNREISTLFVDADGRLWVGTRS